MAFIEISEPEHPSGIAHVRPRSLSLNAAVLWLPRAYMRPGLTTCGQNVTWKVSYRKIYSAHLENQENPGSLACRQSSYSGTLCENSQGASHIFDHRSPAVE